MEDTKKRYILRVVSYLFIFVALFSSYFYFRSLQWEFGQALHIFVDSFSISLSFIGGLLALVIYYNKERDINVLFLGMGFLGVTVIDILHLFFGGIFSRSSPISIQSAIDWSWEASRYFLSIILLTGWIVWKREERSGFKRITPDRLVYIISIFVAVILVVFFLLYPFSGDGYLSFAFGRPEELGSALFFLLAFAGYFSKGEWRKSQMEYWFLIFLIIGFMTQMMFMASSVREFDMMFAVGHILRAISYVCALIGMMYGVHEAFEESREMRVKMLKQANDFENERASCKLTEDSAKKSNIELKQALKEAEKVRNDLEKMNQMMVGREIKMIELKKEIMELREKLSS